MRRATTLLDKSKDMSASLNISAFSGNALKMNSPNNTTKDKTPTRKVLTKE